MTDKVNIEHPEIRIAILQKVAILAETEINIFDFLEMMCNLSLQTLTRLEQQEIAQPQPGPDNDNKKHRI